MRDGLVVVAPMAIEASAIRRNTEAEVRRSGIGAAGAKVVAAQMNKRLGPMAVAGFCGALSGDLRPGDVVIATEVRHEDGVRSCKGASLLAAAVRKRGLKATLGPIVTSTRVVRGAGRKALGHDGAIAVDMESALMAPEDQRPFAVLRVVLDTPEHELFSKHTLPDTYRAYRSLSQAAPALEEWAAAAGPRDVLLAGPRSFCAGVQRAIEIVEKALEQHGPPVYVRKQIVHNRHVVSDLESRGAIFVDELEEVPQGSLVVFSAHGVSPAVRGEAGIRGLDVIDATCPLVSKVHAEARRFDHQGATIFLIGHAGHEEVEGTTGHAPSAIRLIERPEEVDAVVVDDPDNVAFLTQTTLSVDEAGSVSAALRERFPALRGPSSDDICYATQNRQDAVKAIAERSDVVLVVGSTNSSNSRRLVEVVERLGTPAHLIDDDTDIDPAWLIGTACVGVTAGASAPESLVADVVSSLEGLGPVDVVDVSTRTETIHFNLPKEVR